MMDYILLMLLRRMLACTVSHWRVILGAASGAALTCVTITAPVPWGILKLFILHGTVNVIMIKAGLGIKGVRPLARAVVFLYAGGFLLGGIMGFLRQYVRIGSLFFVLALSGYLLASGVWSLMEALIRYNRTHCTAVLCRKERSLKVKALIDTGNRLKDARTGKPVSIIDPGTAWSLGFAEGGAEPEKRRFISYHSIGKERGELPLFEIDRMFLSDGKSMVEVKSPMFAVCGGEMDSDSYKVILNPDIYTCPGIASCKPGGKNIGGNEKI